jgi:hypothetical protein
VPFWTYDENNNLVYVNPDGSVTPAPDRGPIGGARPAPGPMDPYAGDQAAAEQLGAEMVARGQVGPGEHFSEGMSAQAPTAPAAPVPAGRW